MTKELFVSSTPHETKVGLVEDDQLAEVYLERENEYTLAGSIYKGRVTRVLPGMQSAFVDIGLERDAFLYVSDFMEHQDEEGEFETIPANGGGRVQPEQNAAPASDQQTPGREEAEPEIAEPAGEEVENAAAEPQHNRQDAQPAHESNQQRGAGRDDDRSGGRRRRRGRRGGRSFPESKFSRSGNEPRPERTSAPAPNYQPIVLPGESISKYRHLNQQSAAPAATEVHAEPAPVEVHENEPLAEAAETAVQEEQYQEPVPARRPTEEIDVAA